MAVQTPNRFRPFARRRLSTRRPPLVSIRTRNPWVRLRRRVFGWKVRFIDESSADQGSFWRSAEEAKNF
jgi:hypothetical protein